MALVLTVVAVFLLLVANEAWWRQRAAHGELSRKFVHITVGSFVAFWPFWLTWHQIEVLSLAFLIVVGLSRFLGIFQAIHSVQRPTWGEVFFALAVGVIALLTHDKWIYAAALLQMSLADGLAAVLGSRYGGKYKYYFLGHTKSIAGTATFFVVSMIILLAFNNHFPMSLNFGWMVVISVLASLIENVGVWGLDNLLVPVLIALVLING